MSRAAPVHIPLQKTDIQQRHDSAGASIDFRVVVSAHAGPSERLVHAVTLLKPGQDEARHSHDLPMTAHVIAGSGRVDLGTVGHDLAPGDTMFLPAGAPHAWSAGSDGLQLFHSYPADRWDEIAHRPDAAS